MSTRVLVASTPVVGTADAGSIVSNLRNAICIRTPHRWNRAV
ncbi:hypothetical protein [Umezawaea sp. Da 62-37]|nr:hypothetical protein [Umezawaea sp. Da 62-37]WNV87518.1 hypothetical protein RM788_04225 [Umezawaea sp. Da 62-37]